MRTRAFILLLVFFSFHSTASGRQWTDAVGRIVDVPQNPQRIVSLVPSITEMIYAYGLGDRIVGVTRFCDYPTDARQKPLVGDYSNPILERVLALEPDLVLASADMNRPAFIDKLDELGIPAYVVYPRSLSETVATLRSIALLLGAPEAGETLAKALQQKIVEVRQHATGKKPVSVMVCVMLHPLMVAGPHTLADDLVRTAGGRNIVPERGGRFPTWGPESLLAADPDVIIVSSHLNESDSVGYFRKWPELKAVQNHRVVVINPDLILRPGPRLGEGLSALSEALYGPMSPTDIK